MSRFVSPACVLAIVKTLPPSPRLMSSCSSASYERKPPVPKIPVSRLWVRRPVLTPPSNVSSTIARSSSAAPPLTEIPPRIRFAWPRTFRNWIEPERFQKPALLPTKRVSFPRPRSRTIAAVVLRTAIRSLPASVVSVTRAVVSTIVKSFGPPSSVRSIRVAFVGIVPVEVGNVASE